MTADSGAHRHGAVWKTVADVVGTERVSLDMGISRHNVGMYRSREVPAVVRPSTTEQVRRLVQIFDSTADAPPLHPVSTGRNWGLGSREPATDGAVILDLADLDQIRDIDVGSGWAVVEPGVTQGHLAEMLVGTDRMINVTASSAATSFLGNSVDRGVGLRHQRVADLAGLEVVLPDGELIRVGWWPRHDRPSAVYPHGLGPELTPLFLQSNLGIVTAAVVRLLPRPEAQEVLSFGFSRASLVEAVDALRRWTAQGLVSGVLKVYDATSAEFYGGRAGRLRAHVCVDGTPEAVRALAAVIGEEAARTGLFTPETSYDTDVVANMVSTAHSGDPSANDTMVEATLGVAADDIDASGTGWLFFLPIVPFTGISIGRAHGLLDSIYDETGVRCGSTLNALSADLVDFVVSIKFDRGSEADPAHRALDRAYELFSDAGFIPYRIDVDHSEWVDRLSADLSARHFVRRLKQAIDPQRTIAPGRYA